jgi:hypothetical protein
MHGINLGILYLVVISFLITLFFRFLLQIKGPWGSFWAFFIIVLLGIFGTDIWILPIGPNFAGIYWVPPIAFGLAFALLLSVISPSPKVRSEIEAASKAGQDGISIKKLRPFFWLLVVILLVFIIIGFYKSV